MLRIAGGNFLRGIAMKGSSRRTEAIISMLLSRLNGICPCSISKRTQPKEKTSVAGVSGFAASCSGDV